MPTFYNVGHSSVIPNGENDKLAIAPGEAHEFTDEEVAAGMGVEWSSTDPHAGLTKEREWKAKRDAKATHPAKGDSESPEIPTEPAESGDNEGEPA